MRYGKILMPLCLTGAQALAGQVSGGGPSAVKAEEYLLSETDFRSLRERLKEVQPVLNKEGGDAAADQFVIRDEAGNLLIVRKAPQEAVETISQ